VPLAGEFAPLCCCWHSATFRAAARLGRAGSSKGRSVTRATAEVTGADAAAALPAALSLHPASAASSAAAAAAAAAVRAAPPRAFGADCSRGSLPCCGLRCCVRARAVAKGSAPRRSALPASLLPPGEPAALLLSACRRLPLWRASSSPPEPGSQRSKGSAAASPPLLAAAAASWRRSAQLTARRTAAGSTQKSQGASPRSAAQPPCRRSPK
jgi:hypothetical protein